jgi:hypothetical protein
LDGFNQLTSAPYLYKPQSHRGQEFVNFVSCVNETINPGKFQSYFLRFCGKKDTQLAELREHNIYMNRRAAEVLNSV